ncbi:hypothetical protein [Microcoleus sp. D3_18a_C4]|uniref:hypothetical protein n=1 Tax=unclassified Microcoleus TaxID=2642155 RepID=UPI002FD1CFF3
MIAEVIKLLPAAKVATDPWMGLFAKRSELIYEILAESLRNRAAPHQCLDHRIPDRGSWQREVAAWEEQQNLEEI